METFVLCSSSWPPAVHVRYYHKLCVQRTGYSAALLDFIIFYPLPFVTFLFIFKWMYWKKASFWHGVRLNHYTWFVLLEGHCCLTNFSVTHNSPPFSRKCHMKNDETGAKRPNVVVSRNAKTNKQTEQKWGFTQNINHSQRFWLQRITF